MSTIIRGFRPKIFFREGIQSMFYWDSMDWDNPTQYTINHFQTGWFDINQIIAGHAYDDIVKIYLKNGNYAQIKVRSHNWDFGLEFHYASGTTFKDALGISGPQYNNTIVYMSFCTRDYDNAFGVIMVMFDSSDHIIIYHGNFFTAHVDVVNWIAFFDGTEVTEDPYQTAPGADAGGGYGDFDYSSDNIDFSSLPSLSVVDSGFVTLYNPSISQLKDLAQYMWSGLFDINTFRKIFADPMDCIISLAMIPLTPSTAAAQELKVGNIGTGLMINRLNSQFVEVNFAMKNIGLRSNGFMDFSPYTKAQIFLPYIGIRSLSIDDIAGKDLTLKYKIDLFTGACNAALKCGGSVLYQFTGNVIANIPITAQNFSGMLQAAIGAVGAAVGVATGAGALAGVASAVNAATSMKPDIERSGNLSATSGFLGQQIPYLILTYPNLCRPDGRDKTVGTPSFIGLSASNPARPLSSFHGITKLHKINVKSIPCTDAERDEIEALLMEGVILP